MLSDLIYKQEIDITLIQEVIHIDFDRIRGLQRVQGLWKMNRKLLEDTTVRIRFQQEWTRWWEKYFKRNIRLLFVQEGTVRNLENMIKEKFYCTYM
jgi:hypothetical protein